MIALGAEQRRRRIAQFYENMDAVHTGLFANLTGRNVLEEEDSCGAGSPGGEGFEQGNTCAGKKSKKNRIKKSTTKAKRSVRRTFAGGRKEPFTSRKKETLSQRYQAWKKRREQEQQKKHERKVGRVGEKGQQIKAVAAPAHVRQDRHHAAAVIAARKLARSAAQRQGFQGKGFVEFDPGAMRLIQAVQADKPNTDWPGLLLDAIDERPERFGVPKESWVLANRFKQIAEQGGAKISDKVLFDVLDAVHPLSFTTRTPAKESFIRKAAKKGRWAEAALVILLEGATTSRRDPKTSPLSSKVKQVQQNKSKCGAGSPGSPGFQANNTCSARKGSGYNRKLNTNAKRVNPKSFISDQAREHWEELNDGDKLTERGERMWKLAAEDVEEHLQTLEELWEEEGFISKNDSLKEPTDEMMAVYANLESMVNKGEATTEEMLEQIAFDYSDAVGAENSELVDFGVETEEGADPQKVKKEVLNFEKKRLKDKNGKWLSGVQREKQLKQGISEFNNKANDAKNDKERSNALSVANGLAEKLRELKLNQKQDADETRINNKEVFPSAPSARPKDMPRTQQVITGLEPQRPDPFFGGSAVQTRDVRNRDFTRSGGGANAAGLGRMLRNAENLRGDDIKAARRVQTLADFAADRQVIRDKWDERMTTAIEHAEELRQSAKDDKRANRLADRLVRDVKKVADAEMADEVKQLRQRLKQAGIRPKEVGVRRKKSVERYDASDDIIAASAGIMAKKNAAIQKLKDEQRKANEARKEFLENPDNLFFTGGTESLRRKVADKRRKRAIKDAKNEFRKTLKDLRKEARGANVPTRNVNLPGVLRRGAGGVKQAFAATRDEASDVMTALKPAWTAASKRAKSIAGQAKTRGRKAFKSAKRKAGQTWKKARGRLARKQKATESLLRQNPHYAPILEALLPDHYMPLVEAKGCGPRQKGGKFGRGNDCAGKGSAKHTHRNLGSVGKALTRFGRNGLARELKTARKRGDKETIQAIKKQLQKIRHSNPDRKIPGEKQTKKTEAKWFRNPRKKPERSGVLHKAIGAVHDYFYPPINEKQRRKNLEIDPNLKKMTRIALKMKAGKASKEERAAFNKWSDRKDPWSQRLNTASAGMGALSAFTGPKGIPGAVLGAGGALASQNYGRKIDRDELIDLYGKYVKKPKKTKTQKRHARQQKWYDEGLARGYRKSGGPFPGWYEKSLKKKRDAGKISKAVKRGLPSMKEFEKKLRASGNLMSRKEQEEMWERTRKRREEWKKKEAARRRRLGLPQQKFNY